MCRRGRLREVRSNERAARGVGISWETGRWQIVDWAIVGRLGEGRKGSEQKLGDWERARVIRGQEGIGEE